MKYHQSSKDKHCDRINVLNKLVDKYDYSNVNYPATFEDIMNFEHNNKVAVFVYYNDDENQIRTEKKGACDYICNDIIYLLRIENEENSHYVYIKHIERLFNLHANHCTNEPKRFCPICNGKISHDKFATHLKDCYKFAKEGSLLKLPTEGSTMKFKNYKNKLKRPFIVYADTECTLVKNNDPNKIHKHVVNSCCFYFVCTFDSSRNKLWHFRCDDCIPKMIKELYKIGEDCIKEMRNNQAMDLTVDDKKAFFEAKTFCICNDFSL